MKNLKTPIYLDYASTTPIDKRVAEKMFEYMTMDGKYGNPASRSHSFGWDADDAVSQSRKTCGRLDKRRSKRNSLD